MAIKDMFTTKNGKTKGLPVANTTNLAGGKAYAMTDRHALAQFAATGCLGGTYYASADNQLDTVLKLAEKVDSGFLLKTAVYSRKKSFMKDMPALLLAVVAARGDERDMFKRAFPKVVNNGKMLRNFVQVIRSGKLGRSSFGTSLKKLIQNYLDSRTDEELFKDSVGNDPTLADIIKMVHPKPANAQREALYAYLLGKEHKAENLPQCVKQYEAFKKGDRSTIPDVDFRMLTSASLSTEDWKRIATTMPWHALRMNLNTLARNNVFADSYVTSVVAEKLKDADTVRNVKVFPYQLLAAYLATQGELRSSYGYGYNAAPQNAVPLEVSNALQDAMEAATMNIPEINGKVYVFVDTSGSMSASVTGSRNAQSSISCQMVAGLFAASILRKNPTAEIIAFGSRADMMRLNPRDSVMTNTQKLIAHNGGGTNCTAPMELLNKNKANGDMVIYLSDNESWMDGGYSRSVTGTMGEWKKFKSRNPNAKLVCVDLAPNKTTQAQDSKDILNVGGFSDNVFEVVSAFAQGGLDTGHWASVIDGTIV